VATQLTKLSDELPLKDSVRFCKHNRLWTRSELKKQSEALATGWYDLGCRSGDVIAIWLPDYAEKVSVWRLAKAWADLQWLVHHMLKAKLLLTQQTNITTEALL
jgi:acyl-coenzyme A synthetase/AMP-(fatty) acid ligase